MGKIKNPIRFSDEFGVDRDLVKSAGVVDVVINADTRLFIDPLLLETSRHPEIKNGAFSSYNQRFDKIIRLLIKSKEQGDAAWRAAERLFQFHEISWTCLGYGGQTRGSGFGENLIAATLSTALEIIEIGVTDTDLFMVLALFEEGIGPDRISDMTTNIIIDDLLLFNKRILKELGLEKRAKRFNNVNVALLPNPTQNNESPILLVPDDVVRDLPVASDWSEVAHASAQNRDLRARINANVGGIWAQMTRERKAELKRAVLSGKERFQAVLDLIRATPKVPYDLDVDRNGELSWTDFLKISEKYPVDLKVCNGEVSNLKSAAGVVEKIIEQFRFLVEERDLWRELWDDRLEKHKKEKAVQRIFYAIAHSYCESNDLDITPEAETGNGPVDFKLSRGSDDKVLVEIKLSSNTRIVHGYEKQLEIYKAAEASRIGYYLIVDVGKMGDEDQKLIRIKNERVAKGMPVSEIEFVDATPKASASKRH